MIVGVDVTIEDSRKEEILSYIGSHLIVDVNRLSFLAANYKKFSLFSFGINLTDLSSELSEYIKPIDNSEDGENCYIVYSNTEIKVEVQTTNGIVEVLPNSYVKTNRVGITPYKYQLKIGTLKCIPIFSEDIDLNKWILKDGIWTDEDRIWIDEDVWKDKYVQLEYLEITGTQYIDTGIVIDGVSDFGYSLSFIIKRMTEQPRFLSNESGYAITDLRLYNSNLYYRNANSQITLNRIDVDRKYSIECDGALLVVEDDDGGVYRKDIPRDISNCPNSIYLLTRRNASGQMMYQFIGCIFYFSLSIDKNKVIDLIPVKDTTTDEVGMLDLISGEFFSNKGTGKFIAGPIVEH